MENKYYKGYIRWFDNVAGIGYVKVPELERDVKVHWSADERLNKFENKSLSYRKNKLFITYKHLDIVEVKIHFDYGWEQVSSLKFSDWTTKENILSDALINYLENTNEHTNSDWDTLILNNIISGILEN